MTTQRFRRLIRGLLGGLAATAFLGLVLAGTAWWYFHPAFEHEKRIVYGIRHGHDLTLDVIRPEKANGAAVVFVVSGGWSSSRSSIRPWIIAPLLRRGYTVFPVCHLSQPEATVMESAADLERAIRFIRRQAGQWEIDPARIGISGGSSGGHLALLTATRGGPGDPDASDPVDRESSAVQAVAVFFPVTDLLDLGESTQNPGDGGPPIDFVEAFGPGADHLPTWKRIGAKVSPIDHISADLPPILIHHGDEDTLVPLDQSTRFQDRANDADAGPVELVVHRGRDHGWITMPLDLLDFADWYDRWLSADLRQRL